MVVREVLKQVYANSEIHPLNPPPAGDKGHRM